MNRRRFLKYAAAGAVVVVAAAGGLVYYESGQKISLKVGTALKTASQWVPIYLAQSKNFWSQYSLDVEVVSFTGGATLLDAFKAGDVSMGDTGGLGTLQARDVGIPLQIVAQLTAVNNFVLVVGKDSKISQPKDLNGTKIGVASIGGLLDIQAQDLAAANGITINSVPLGNLDKQLTALQLGEIDGFVWAWDGGYLAEDKNIGKILLFFSSIYPDWKISSAIAAPEDLIKSNPEAIRRVLQALFGTVKYMNSHVDETTTFSQQYLGLNADTAKKAWQDQKFSTDGVIDMDGVRFAAELAVRAKLLKGPPQVDAAVNTSFTPVEASPPS